MLKLKIHNKFKYLIFIFFSILVICTCGYVKKEKPPIETGSLQRFVIKVIPETYRFAIYPNQPILITLKGEADGKGTVMLIRKEYVPEIYENTIKNVDGIIKRSGVLELIPQKTEYDFSEKFSDVPGVHVDIVYSGIGRRAGIYNLEELPQEVETLLYESMALARQHLHHSEKEIISGEQALEYIESGQKDDEEFKIIDTFILVAKNGNIDSLKALFTATEDANVVDENGLTALMAAAYVGNEEIIRLLLEYGAYVDAADNDGYTALMYACNAGQLECVEILAENGANVNHQDNDGSTPIMFASQHGYSNIVRFLLKNGANPQFRGKHGYSAVDFAKQNGHTETERILRLYKLK